MRLIFHSFIFYLICFIIFPNRFRIELFPYQLEDFYIILKIFFSGIVTMSAPIFEQLKHIFYSPYTCTQYFSFKIIITVNLFYVFD